jgi:hypothetical protein
MRPPIIAAALVLVICLAALDQAKARVVRDDQGAPANPAVEAGGHRLLTAPSPSVPYSLIGAMANEDRWVGACSIWPWKLLDRFSLRPGGARARMTIRPFEEFRHLPLPMK